MTSQLKYLVKEEDANMSVGHWAPQKFVDALAARNYTICNLYTLASFGQFAVFFFGNIVESSGIGI